MPKYCVVVAGDPVRDEWTNVGVIVFDENGQYFGHRASLLRAISRLDWPQTDDHQATIDAYCQMWPSLEAVSKGRDSTAHCMSSLQLKSPCGSLLQCDALLDYAWRRLVDVKT